MEKATADLHIASCEAKPAPREIPAEKVTIAYGSWAFPKLVREMMSEELVIRQNVLASACNLLKTAKNVSSAVDAAIVEVLTMLLHDGDAVVRLRAVNALGSIAAHRCGRSSIIEFGALNHVGRLLHDLQKSVRRNCYVILTNMCDSVEGLCHLVDVGYVPALVERSAREVTTIQPLALSVLCRIMKHPDDTAIEQALAEQGVETVITLLDNREMQIRRKAATALTLLCFSEEAKKRAIEGGAIPALCPLLVDSDSSVRAYAAGALMGITTEDAGKRQLLEQGGVELVTTLLLQSDDALVLINALKVVGNMAAMPEARSVLRREALGRLKELSERGLEGASEMRNSVLQRSAKTCVRLVEWRP